MKLIIEIIVGAAVIFYGRLAIMDYMGLPESTAEFIALALGFLVMAGISACFNDKKK